MINSQSIDIVVMTGAIFLTFITRRGHPLFNRIILTTMKMGIIYLMLFHSAVEEAT